MHISRFHFTNLGGFYDEANFTSFRVFVLIWNLPKDLRKIDEHANRIITQHQHTFGNILEFMFLGQSDYDYYRNSELNVGPTGSAWKVFVFGVFLVRIWSECRKMDQKNSKYGHFSRSVGARKCRGKLRVESSSKYVPKNYKNNGLTLDRSFCITFISSIDWVYSLETKCQQYMDRCSTDNLDWTWILSSPDREIRRNHSILRSATHLVW